METEMENGNGNGKGSSKLPATIVVQLNMEEIIVGMGHRPQCKNA